MELKDFQKEALAKLDAFLRAARAGTLAGAFEQTAKPDRPDLFRPYRPLTDATAEAPFVCLRLPTGGGKTILATHAVKTAAEAWLCTDSPLVLWLVPTSMIRDQTLDALQDAKHPYRQALDDAYKGRVRVLALSNFARLRPQDLVSRANTSSSARWPRARGQDREPQGVRRLQRRPGALLRARRAGRGGTGA